MRVLVTGGAGFIGSNLVRRLVKERAVSVTVLDNLHRGRLENLSDCFTQIHFLQADVRDTSTLQEALHGVDLVYHLAAQSSVINATGDLNYTFNTNVGGTFNLLQAAKMNKSRRVVFASSREVYGDPEQLPVPETAPVRPRNAYGASKAASEAFCWAYGSDGPETSVLRLANVYGPGDRDRVLPLFIENALEHLPLVLYGGQQVLDFVWIDTVVEAFLQVGFGELISGPLNVGSGIGVAISNLARRILKLTHSHSAVEIAPSRKAEADRPRGSRAGAPPPSRGDSRA
jgi:UDP-glucose 4-epimerase